MKSKKPKKLDLSALERFLGLEDKQEFKLIKLASKRDGSRVGVRQYETGDFYFYKYPATNKLPAQVGAEIVGRGFNYLRTSPIVKVTEHDDISTTFETEGGIYKLQKWPKPRSATEPKKCPKCETVTDLKDMEMKMGGLLCPKCRVILYQPYVDEEYFDERARRYKEEAETDKQEGDL